jgi:hypothetical protein
MGKSLKGNTIIAVEYFGHIKGRHCGLLVTIGMIFGCTGAPIKQLSVQVASDETSFLTHALDATVTQFVGPQTKGPKAGVVAGGQSTVSLGGITAHTLTPKSGTAYIRNQSVRRFVALEMQQPLMDRQGKVRNWHLTGRVALGQGNSQYKLPDGIGILKDPISIDFDTHFISTEAELAWKKPLGTQAGAALGLALGQRTTHSQTKITSALLDVHNNSWQTKAYLALRAGLWLQPDPTSSAKIRVDLEALGYPGETGSIGAVLQMQY